MTECRRHGIKHQGRAPLDWTAEGGSPYVATSNE